MSALPPALRAKAAGFGRVVAAVAAAALATLWLRPVGENPFAFECELASARAGRIQVYFDRGGHGFSEPESAQRLVEAGEALAPVRLPLPEGRYHALRFDPTDGDGTVRFRHARITGPGGRIVLEIDPARLEGNSQVARLVTAGGVTRVDPAPGANDAFLVLPLRPSLRLRYSWPRRLADAWPVWAALAAGLWLAAAGAGRAWAGRHSLGAAARRRPQAALGLLALGSAVLASYPVVFFGRSFVSPNVGTALLYSRAPFLPGYSDSRLENVHGADVGSLMWQQVPQAIEMRRVLSHGHLPLWERHDSTGLPWLGQGQSMVGDPLQALVDATGGRAWAWDVKFVLAKALFAAGLGLCVWRLGGGLAGASLSTLSAPFVGFYSFRINHAAIFSVSYAPWILLGWLVVAAARDRRALARGLALWLLANTAVFASGTVKEAYILGLCLNAVGGLAWILALPRRPAAERRRALLAVGAALAGWILLTAPLWLVFAETLRGARTLSDAPDAWQAPRGLLIGFFDDLFFRAESPAGNVFLPAGNFLLLLGLPWAFVGLRRLAAAPAALGCAVATGVSLLLAYQFVPRTWILAIPVLRNIYHVDNVFSDVALVAGSVVAGCGFQTARERLSRPGSWRPLAGTLLFPAALLAGYFARNPSFRHVTDHAFFFANLAALLVAAAVLLAAARAAGRPQSAAKAVAWTAASAVALAAILLRHGQHLPGMNWHDGYLNLPGVRTSFTAPSPAVDLVRRDSAGPFRAVGLDNTLFAGFTSVYGIEGVNGPEPLESSYYRDLLQTAGWIAPGDWMMSFTPANLAERRRLLDFLGVRYVLSPAPLPAPMPGYTPVADLDLDVYRSTGAWPRAFFTDRLGRYDTTDDLLAMVDQGNGRPFAAMQAGDPARPDGLPDDLAGRQVIPAHDYELGPNTTAFDAETTGPGVVVLQEAWWPDDFTVTVDDEPAACLRLNHAFKGVAIPTAGFHHIEFTYRPRFLGLALALGAAGLAVLAELFRRLLSSPGADGPRQSGRGARRA